jgi:hypothetical protein
LLVLIELLDVVAALFLIEPLYEKDAQIQHFIQLISNDL